MIKALWFFMVEQQGSHVGANLQHGNSLPISSTAGLSFEQSKQLLDNIFASIDQDQLVKSKKKSNASVGPNNQKSIPGGSDGGSAQPGSFAHGDIQATANNTNGFDNNTLQTQAVVLHSSKTGAVPPESKTIAVDAQGANVAKRISRAANLNLEGEKIGRLTANRPDLRQNVSAAKQHVIYNTKSDVPSMDENIGHSTSIISSDATNPRGIMQSNMKGMLKQALMQNLQASNMLNTRPSAALQGNSYSNNQSAEDVSKLTLQPDESVDNDPEVGLRASAEQGLDDIGLFYGALDDDDVDYVDTQNVAVQADSIVSAAPLQSVTPQHLQEVLQSTEPDAGMQRPVATNMPQTSLLHDTTQMLILEKDRPGSMPVSNDKQLETMHVDSKDFTINENDILNDLRSGNFTSMAFIPANLPKNIADNRGSKIMPIILPRELYDAIFKPKGS